MNHILCLFKKLGHRKLGVIAAVFTLFHLSFLHAQNETFRSFTIEDGLPENTGNVLMQDTKGQLWIGTQAGVAIYDGVRFKNIGTEGEEGYALTNNMIEGLYEDENGRVYIGTRNGMNIYDPYTQKVQNIILDSSASYGNNLCRNSFFEDDLYVWFIGKYALYNLHKSNLELKTVAQFESSALGVMQAYHDGLLIAAGTTLLFFNLQSHTYQELIALPHNITSFAIIDNRLWIGTLGGIYDLQGETILDSLQTEAVLYIKQSSDNRVWIGTANGIALYEDGRIRFIRSNANNGLEGNLQLSFMEDKNGLLWFGTNSATNMLIPWSEKIEKNTDNRLIDLPSSHVNSLTYLNRHHILAIGTENGVNISKLNPGTQDISVTSYKNFLENEPINFINKDALDRIWVGTKSGDVYCFNEDFTHFQLKGNIKGIRGFYYDTKNKCLYIAGAGGLYAAGEDRVIYRPHWAEEIKYTVSILDKENGFWVSHSDLIYEVDLLQKKVINISANHNEIPSYMITNQLSINDKIWFSSISGGVYSYDSVQGIWAQNNVLKSKNIWSTFADSKGRLWSNSDDGLYIHNGKEIFQKLDINDGLNYTDFKMTAHCQLENGLLVYGNNKGLSIINPSEFENKQWSATPYISGIEINFKSQPTSKLNDLLLLKPDEKSIILHVGLDGFLYSSGAEISYKLENLNTSWSLFLPITYPINFTGLSAGDYSLLVKVRDKSGRVSDKILVQKIKRLPHFYETKFFKIIVFLTLLMLLVFVANFRAYQNQKAAENELKTERAISSERERISRDLHDSIGARLTKIVSDLDIMELQAEIKQQAVSIQDLSKTRDFTQDTINNLRETIWMLDSKTVRFQDLFHQSKKYIERYLPEGIEFEIKMDDRLFPIQINPVVAVNIFRIIQELTQNMLKYSGATKYSVSFASGKNINLTVWDNGAGFDINTVSKGEGLKNMIKRLDEIQAKWDFKNNNGSKFIIHLN